MRYGIPKILSIKPDCSKCVHEKNCQRLKTANEANKTDGTYRLLVRAYGCHAFKQHS